MKKRVSILFCIFLLVTSIFAGSGGIPEKIYFNVKMQEEIGLKDASEGITDVFLQAVNGSTIKNIDKNIREKLDLYQVPSGSWSLIFNPYPNAAPYIVKSKDTVNPFAIQKVRYAMNFLINRKYIVDEILSGAGAPMFNMATPGWPSSYKYELLATKFGMSAEGNEKKAIKDVTDALTEASNLPQLKGKLLKSGQWWTYNGKPLTINFMIRVDDPNGRLRLGEYIAQQIEKTGIKVERLKWDRSKCFNVMDGTNPADYEWNIYTEGYVSGQYYNWWEQSIAQMYAPFYGNMPGKNKENFWSYSNKELDDLIQLAFTGQIINEKEYWDSCVKSTEIGMKEAVRVNIVSQDDYYGVNKARFKQRLLYDMGVGINRWALQSAQTKDNILRITQFSSRGSLFMGAWNPISPEGLNDVFSTRIYENLVDKDVEFTPNDGTEVQLRVDFSDIQTKVHKDKAGNIVGDIMVPENAIMYNTVKNQWEKVPANTTVFSKTTYTLKGGKWHSGRDIKMSDYLYVLGFISEWTNEDGKSDKKFDPFYSSTWKSTLDTIKGLVINSDKSMTVYFNYNFPPSKLRVAAQGVIGLKVQGPAQNAIVSWEIYEALSQLVTEGSASKTQYSLTTLEGVDEIDVLSPKCVKDIRAKLVELKEKAYIPEQLKGFISKEEVVKDYENAVKFIDTYKHAFIGNGPYYLTKVDTETNFMELTKFKEANVPYNAGDFYKKYSSKMTRIDQIIVPETAEKVSNLKVKAKVSEVSYPGNVAKPMTSGTVKVSLITAKSEYTYDAKPLGNGIYEVNIPSTVLSKLAEGTYTILVNAVTKGGLGTSGSQITVLY